MPGFVFQPLRHSLTTLSSVAYDLVHFLILVARSRRLLAAENLYLRKQLALFQERKLKPEWPKNSCGLSVVVLEKTAEAFVTADRWPSLRRRHFATWE